MSEPTAVSEPISHFDDLRLALSELLDEQSANVAELYVALIRRCGYGAILEVADVLEALDDLVAWGWVSRRSTEARPDEPRFEITPFGRGSRRNWVEEEPPRRSGERWSLDHDAGERVLCILADSAATAERVLRWWKRMHPDVAVPEETRTVQEIGEFRSRSGARARRGVRLVCRCFLLC